MGGLRFVSTERREGRESSLSNGSHNRQLGVLTPSSTRCWERANARHTLWRPLCPPLILLPPSPHQNLGDARLGSDSDKTSVSSESARPARLPRLAIVLATTVVFGMAVTLGAARAELLSPLAAFGIVVVAQGVGGFVTALVGCIALALGAPGPPALRPQTRRRIMHRRASRRRSRPCRNPRIRPREFTTSQRTLADPPVFVAALDHPHNAGRDLSYPHGDARTPQEQAIAYGDLRPIHVDLEARAAFAAALRVAQACGWNIVARDEPALRIEATDTTRWFRFVDDVVIRIRPSDSGAVVDLRSTSRVGRGDMGANAARIRRFAASLSADGSTSGC